MNPFWMLVVGIGLAWFIKTGRGGAIWTVITSPLDSAGTNQGTSADNCQPGETWNELLQKCVATTNPPAGSRCTAGHHWDDLLGTCVPDQPGT